MCSTLLLCVGSCCFLLRVFFSLGLWLRGSKRQHLHLHSQGKISAKRMRAQRTNINPVYYEIQRRLSNKSAAASSTIAASMRFFGQQHIHKCSKNTCTLFMKSVQGSRDEDDDRATSIACWVTANVRRNYGTWTEHYVHQGIDLTTRHVRTF